MKVLLGVLLSFVVSLTVSAQTKKYQYRGQIKDEGAQIYKEANFDSEVIAEVPPGRIFDISSKVVNGAFYRIRIKPGVIGYVSDAEITPLFKTATSKPSQEKKKPTNQPTNQRQARKEKDRKRPFHMTQFAGVQTTLMQYREDTMGAKRTANLSFIGAKVSGPDILIEGAFPTEMNFQFYFGAPGYYEELTKKAADGWIFLTDFLFQTYYPHGQSAFTFIGFGPMMKYSKYRVALTEGGQTKYYSLDDMAVGAAFQGGVALRVGTLALRGDFTYYWEKQQYWGTALSLQFPF